MTGIKRIAIFAASFLVSWGHGLAAPVGVSTYVHFEARQRHPLALAGQFALAVNSPAGSLVLFDVSAVPSGGAPVLHSEIPVGVEPVSVRVRSATEVWVVNEVSDSISVVDLTQGIVSATIQVPDEPADVVFVGDFAVVSCARSNLLRVIDANTRQEVRQIPMLGLYPASLALSPDGRWLYVAFLLSGNQTTILAAHRAPAQPAPTNPGLPAAPDTAEIVPVSHPKIWFRVYDHDVAVIDTVAWKVDRYLPSAGTLLHYLAVQPSTGNLFVANTDARNLVRFEPNLRGNVVRHRLTRYNPDGTGRTSFDLNPGRDATVLPDPDGRRVALAEPSAIAFTGNNTAWVAAFGSDRLARIHTGTGNIETIVDLRPESTSSRSMRGPRGMIYDEAAHSLYVLNKISDTLMVVSAATGTVTAELPLGSRDPMPPTIRQGRGFLFDARLSGSGTVSCASCHVDADRDGLAWDLGDPAGNLTTALGVNFANHETENLVRPFHPMKGPMVTQTLRNLRGGAPFHWRGDMPTLAHFNATFATLLGGQPLATEDFTLLETYLLSLRHHPNPNRKLDNSLPTTLVGGNPTAGRRAFNVHANHCAECHGGPRGSNNNIDDFRLTDSRDPVKTPPLQTVYQRVGFDGNPGGVNITGFGLNRNGAGSQLPTVHFYELSNLRPQDLKDVTAFLLSFDTGTAAAVGQTRTLLPTNRDRADLLADLLTLEVQARNQAIDLVAEGQLAATPRALRFDPTSGLYTDSTSTFTRADLLAALSDADALTFTALPPGQAAGRVPTP